MLQDYLVIEIGYYSTQLQNRLAALLGTVEFFLRQQSWHYCIPAHSVAVATLIFVSYTFVYLDLLHSMSSNDIIA